jgi:chloramphenicol-sensitive protein RarD
MTDSTTARRPADRDDPRGFAYALACYAFWGMMPLYVAMLSHIPSLEVLAHRVLWSLPLALVALALTGKLGALAQALREPRTVIMAALASAVVTVNWGVYIYAIHIGQAMQAALGYYINPLFSILLGFLLLGERLSPLKWLAVGFAFAAVVVLALDAGELPWLALLLMFSWGFYAYFKRSLPVGPNEGFALEVLLLFPFALAYLAFAEVQGWALFPHTGFKDFALLFGMGMCTALPLILYANGAKLLRLSTIAIMQYISPTCIFLLAVFVFGEPFGRAQAIAFPLIWVAMIFYVVALVVEGRARRRGI